MNEAINYFFWDKEDLHRTYGGQINAEDFVDYKNFEPKFMSDIAEEIIRDMKFDERCRKNK